ncbi:MAG TPA: transglutaminase domain-containing protein [Ferruginibacter sp.]|nr:transglutaminase domain-containing protein [Ferruginibacter sp.]
MLRILLIFILVFTGPLHNYAQQSGTAALNDIPAANCVSVDALASYIKQNYNSDSARIRAIYLWVTNNISYDVPRLLAREQRNSTPAQAAAETLTSRTAVCQGYADLFVALSNAAGIHAVEISGYGKQRGKISETAHAWAAAPIDGVWYLFDPTWGAGYVRNESFVKRFTDNFYKVSPEKFIADHMPFDPMYQFLSYPLTNREFMDGTAASGKSLFNYNDSIKQHAALSPAVQKAAQLRRLEAAGVVNDLVRERRAYLMKGLQNAASKNSFEEGGKVFKLALALYKDLMGHKKKQFSTISDSDLKQQVDSIAFYVKRSRSLVSEAIATTDAQWEAKTNNLRNIDRFWVELIKQKEFTEQYLATDKERRKLMFKRN